MKALIQRKNGNEVANLNRRRAIRERCLNCSAWNPSNVKQCKMTDCALFQYRSGKGKQDAKARAKAIRDYCLWCMAGQRNEISKCVSPDCPLFPYRNAKIDRTVDIKSLPQKSHIEGSQKAETKKAYHGIG